MLRKASHALTPAAVHNVKINQDRNPWPKAEIAVAVDPSKASNLVVMSNDFRVNWDEEFYHVSTNGGTKWTDDRMVGGADPFTGGPNLLFRVTRVWRLTRAATAIYRRLPEIRFSTSTTFTRT